MGHTSAKGLSKSTKKGASKPRLLPDPDQGAYRTAQGPTLPCGSVVPSDASVLKSRRAQVGRFREAKLRRTRVTYCGEARTRPRVVLVSLQVQVKNQLCSLPSIFVAFHAILRMRPAKRPGRLTTRLDFLFKRDDQ